MVLDPTKKEVYEVINGVIAEWARLFPDPYIHIGGDVVDSGSWLNNPEIVSFMETKGYQDHNQLQAYFSGRVSAILARHGKKTIGWDGLSGADLGKGAVIQTWRGQGWMNQALQDGHYAILSGDYFLDKKLPASFHYSVSPDDVGGEVSIDPSQRQMILGGEACMWTEVVDARSIDSRIWPRMAAIAEKFWSPLELTQDPVDMYRRMHWISQYLDYSGITHNSDYPKFVESLCPSQNQQPLITFIDVLEEVKSYDPEAIDTAFTTTTPLDRVVDVARPESQVAVDFNILVFDFIKMRDPETSHQIRSILENWSQNHELLAAHFKSCEKLMEVQELSASLAEISQVGLSALTALETNALLPASQLSSKVALMNEASISEAGVMIAVTESIRGLVTAAHGENG